MAGRRGTDPSPAWIGDRRGTTALVTGGSAGVGWHVVRALAVAGSSVVLTSRDPVRGAEAVARLRAQASGADVRAEVLDLADLASVRSLAVRVLDRVGPLDLLVTNAGVMGVPERTLTAQGFELQLGVNHLGHAALTALLLPALQARPGARVVGVSSGIHAVGRIDVDDLQSERRYSPWRAYAQSKLANVLHAVELQRRADRAGLELWSTAAHPGLSATGLWATGPGLGGHRVTAAAWAVVGRLVGQPPEHGSWPLTYAATSPDVIGGGWYGPGGLAGARGRPTLQLPSSRATDPEVAAWLWARTEELTGIASGL